MTHSSRRTAWSALFLPAVLSIVLLAAFPAHAAGPQPGWPLRPRPEVVRGFEPPPLPWSAGHRGVDLAGSPGQPVLSATAGTITYAGQLAGRGVIVVSHGLFRTTYEPVVPAVRAGVTVAVGERIGQLSAAGSHCPPGACLHWGLRQGEEYLDPLSLLTSGPVRLLPLGRPSPPPPGREPQPRSSLPVKATGTPAAGSGGDAGEGRPAEDGAGGLVVGIAAALTVGGGLLVRRH